MAIPSKKLAGPPSVLPPLPKKPKTLRELMRGTMSQNIRILVAVDDCSGSMNPWAKNRSTLLANFRQHMLTHYAAVAGRLFVVYVAISGGFVIAGPTLIGELEQPDIESGGITPLGTALKALRELLEHWLATEVEPAEATVKDLQTVFFGDVLPSKHEHQLAVAEAGQYRRLTDAWGGEISAIGPDPEHMCWEVVDALGVKRDDVKYLDKTDPDSILKWVIESVSGKGLSDPGITIAPAKG